MNSTPHASPPSRPRRLMVIAGEISGDEHAARVVRELKTSIPDLELYGIGGEALQAEGLETYFDINSMAVMGVWEVLRQFAFFRRVLRDITRLLETRRPDAVLLVDYPGFNMRIAAAAHALGIKTVYYICPKVWVWKASRIPKLAATVDRLLTIFPFEAACFADTDLQVDFVGHPLVDRSAQILSRPAVPLKPTGDPLVALLPGSRPNEIRRILPAMWDAAQRIEGDLPGVSYILPSPTRDIEQIVRETIAALPGAPSRWATVVGHTHDALRQARAAIVTSGTATLDASLMMCPMIITYRVTPISFAIGRRVVHVRHVGLVNIVGDEDTCPELLQSACNGRELSAALLPLLADTPERQTMLEKLRQVNERLGAPGASRRAATAIWNVLEGAQ